MKDLNPFGRHSPISMRIASAMVALALGCSLLGCERKEKVLDIKAPGIDIEVEKSDRGAPDLDIKVKKPADGQD